uniref:alpha-galactosidase n=1 Tax=Heterorhabditis bacteriophora TaxID=37862 RepID=A0A1I7X840_HETBA
MSNDLRLINPEFKAVLLNRDVIAINQDPMGKMGRLVANTTDIGVYVKPVTPVHGDYTSFAVGILNRNINTTNSIEFILEDIGLTNSAGYEVKNLWTGQMLGIMKPSDVYKTVVPSTGADMFKATLIEK